jgi:hypothetical protein
MTRRRRWSVSALPHSSRRFEHLHDLGSFQYQHYSNNNQRTAEHVLYGQLGKSPSSFLGRARLSKSLKG